jgi:hypothetical protein
VATIFTNYINVYVNNAANLASGFANANDNPSTGGVAMGFMLDAYIDRSAMEAIERALAATGANTEPNA